ncbi:hypothetical protein MKY98_26750 [Paenibacillus sp. FSL M8-0228]|uniref:hypothetical protein n=1 Tax=Paenibacillus TaxID=44249 RepID=UPI00083DFEF5|nr:hypothetical protein [Paenibacillus polymyxa]MBO3287567.1 hypothetical protein [Paenibacillus polymyxa]ODB54940.1 hypothetical protein A7311_20910 [Paenibacillus polymyxa]
MYKALLSAIILFSLCFNPNVEAATSKNVNIKYSTGAIYYGQVRNGKPNGSGTMKYDSYKTYQGQWSNGLRSGKGKYIYKKATPIYNEEDGELNHFESSLIVYQGSWKNDKYNGEGTYTEKNTYRDYVHSDYTQKYEEQFNDDSANVKKGTFKNNKLIKGYSGGYSRDLNTLSYTDGNVNISLETDQKFYEFPNLNKTFKNAFSSDYPEKLSFFYSKKISQSLLKQLSLSEQSLEQGIFTNDSKISSGSITTKGDNYNTNSIIDTWTKEDYINGAAIQMKELSHTGISNLYTSYGNQYMALIKPYSRGFSDLQSILYKL